MFALISWINIYITRHVNNIWWKTYEKRRLISEKGLSDINCEKLEKALIYIKNNFINYNNIMYLNIDSLMEINNLITGSNNIVLRKVTVNPYGYDKCIWINN